jgi:hypothetical protein
MLFGHLALAAAALFTGAAFYINFAEQPARLLLDDQSLLTEWKPAYQRGYTMQASLAIAGFVLGFLAWWQIGGSAFIVGALLMLANWPWTLIAIMPTNNTLLGTAEASPETRDLVVKWGYLHAVRTALGGAALLCFLYGLSVPQGASPGA